MKESESIRMTDEEMIDTLKGLVFGSFDRTTAKEREALNLVIQKLEQQPSVDCISRAQALHACCDEWNKDYKAIMKSIRQLPSVTPQQTRWIPVSERLPDKSGEYWCTFRGTNLTGKDYYTTESDAKKLFDDSEEYMGWRSQNVIAWMPLPTVYRESEDK